MSRTSGKRWKARRLALEILAATGDVRAKMLLQQRRVDELMFQAHQREVATAANRPLGRELAHVPAIPGFASAKDAVLINLPRLRDVRPTLTRRR